jgi:chemotaxis-related protein WspB
VPVVDLSELMLGEPARPHISTRLILVRHGGHLLGLVAERATEMLRCEAGCFAASGLASDSTPFLGSVTQDGDRLIRWIDVQKLPQAVSGDLFRQAG